MGRVIGYIGSRKPLRESFLFFFLLLLFLFPWNLTTYKRGGGDEEKIQSGGCKFEKGGEKNERWKLG